MTGNGLTGMELRITSARGSTERVVHVVPIADEAELRAARQWVDESDSRWSSLGGGALRREIVSAGGEVQ